MTKVKAKRSFNHICLGSVKFDNFFLNKLILLFSNDALN